MNYSREKATLVTVSTLLVLLLKNCNAQNLYEDPWNESYNSRCPRVYPRNFLGYAPRGNLTAGNYTERSDLKGLKQCVLGCCTAEICHVVFMHDATCYHIQCASDELCLPLLRSENPRLGTHVTMVLVSPVLEEENWQEIILEQGNYGSELGLPNLSLEDEIISNLANAEHQGNLLSGAPLDLLKYKAPYSSDSDILSHFSENIGSKENYLDRQSPLSRFTNKDRDIIMDGAEDFTEKLVTCEDGVVTDCPPDEECVSYVTKSRSGICKCIEGYIRNGTGVCIGVKSLGIVPYSSGPDIKKNSEKESNILFGKNSDKIKKDEVKAGIETSSKSSIKKLTVSAISKEVRLPENEVTLSAYTIPDEKTTNDHYNYAWKLVDQPKGGFTGNMKEQNGGTVTLSQLTEGSYKFKVSVTGSATRAYGEAYANVSVLPPNRINRPPVVVITPAAQNVKLPNTGAVLDGSDSKDDDAIISWHWELTSGPLGYQPPLRDGPTLQLRDLKLPGNYTFRLTVEDSDHVKNSTTANITVLNHTDYPPEANAGQDIIIYLPTNNLTLNGNLSSDDHEISTWEWTKSSQDQDKAVDMQNTHSPYLQLSNLSEGMYTFVLKVTDSSGQSSTADVHVFVKPPTNTPPTAKAGKHQYISLPLTRITLNGSESYDDHRIVAYTWHVLKGPTNATLTHFNESITNLTGLTKGEYRVQLTVLDDNGNSAADTVHVTVTQNKNAAPKANAGGDQTVTLPVSAIIINGSQSRDDLRIARWLWLRQPTGLATGTIISDSDQHPILMLTDLVAGRYVFSLTVWDDQGLSDTDTVSINVKTDPERHRLVQLSLSAAASVLTQAQLVSLQQKLGLLLGETYYINVTRVRADPLTTAAQVIFYVSEKKNSDKSLPGPEVVSRLKKKLRRDAGLLQLNVALLDTVVCQNNCSGHGVCHEPTRQCHCQAFWMQNILTPFIDDMDANCDWSILYVVMGGLALGLSVVTLCWGLCCALQRVCGSAPAHRRPARYTLLGAADDETARFAPGKMSMSDSDTDCDVLFESRSKGTSLASRFGNGEVARNGHPGKNGARNGFLKSGRRVKT